VSVSVAVSPLFRVVRSSSYTRSKSPQSGETVRSKSATGAVDQPVSVNVALAPASTSGMTAGEALTSKNTSPSGMGAQGELWAAFARAFDQERWNEKPPSTWYGA
jgi:hypothetical protein